MSTPRTPHPEPVKPASPTTDHDNPAATSRTSRTISIAALVLAVAAIALAGFGFITRATAPAAACQEQAWDVVPAEDQLPAEWMTSATQYDLSRKSMSFLGPIPADEVSTQAVIYATITCFDQGAEEAVNRSRQAAEDAGQSVIDRSDLGDQSFSAVDDTGAAFLQLRHGPIVVYLAGLG